MKRKHLYVILAALAAGLLLYAPTLVWRPDGGRDGAAPEDAFRIEGMEASAARTIRIAHPDGEAARLEMTDLGWRVNGHRADSARVADLLAAIDTMTATRVVARNPENHARLEVTPETGRTVELRAAGGESFTFHVGRRDLGTGGYHVRREADDRVWLLQGPVGGYVGRVVENRRDRVLARLDTARVREILLRRGDAETVLERGEGGWSLADGPPADSATISGLLRRLPELFSTNFPPDSVAAAADFSSPDAVLSIFSEEEGDVTERELVLSLRFLRREEGEPWLVKRADEAEVYELSQAVAEALLPSRERLEGGDSSG